MSEKLRFKTPRGEAFFPSLNRTESYKGKDTGKYTCKVIFEGEALEEMKAVVQDFIAENFPAKKAPKVKSPFKVTKEGNKVYVKFTTKSIPVIYDSKGQPVKRELNVGSGSIVRVGATLQAIDGDDPGVVCYMSGVQIVRLKEYVPGGGFEAEEDEEGFVGDEFDGSDEEPEQAPKETAKATRKRADF